MQNQESTLLTDNSKYKVVLLGESAVGKTSIVQYLTNGTFHQIYDPTLYLDSIRKNVVYNGRVFKLTFWDTAGQEKFNSLAPAAIRGSQCGLIVFDVSDRNSFTKCSAWIKMLKDCNRKSNCAAILIGNKSDLQRKVTKSEAFDLAVENQMVYIETSAKQGTGIQNLMIQIIESMESKIQKSTKSSEQIPKSIIAAPKLNQERVKLKKPWSNCCSI